MPTEMRWVTSKFTLQSMAQVLLTDCTGTTTTATPSTATSAADAGAPAVVGAAAGGTLAELERQHLLDATGRGRGRATPAAAAQARQLQRKLLFNLNT